MAVLACLFMAALLIAPGKAGQSDEEAGEERALLPDPGLELAVCSAAGELPDELSLSDLESLKSLDARSMDISSLDGIQHCKDLTMLDLGQNKITDIQPLTSLKRLAVLDLSDNNIPDVSALAGLKSLKVLWLKNNPVQDISQLVKLKKLFLLDLSRSGINDITHLAELPELSVLIMVGNNVEELSQFSRLKKLAQLYLGDNNISDIGPLGKLSSLTVLHLGNNNVSDITPLAKLYKLEKLYLWGNKIGVNPQEGFADLAPLEGLTRLRYINLGRNNITDVTPLVNNCDSRGKIKGRECSFVLYLNDNPLNEQAREQHLPYLLNKGVAVMTFAEEDYY